jgi:hypothetical protein
MMPAYRTVEYHLAPQDRWPSRLRWVDSIYEGNTYGGMGFSIQEAVWDAIRLIEHEYPDGPPVWLVRRVEAS